MTREKTYESFEKFPEVDTNSEQTKDNEIRNE